MPKYDYTAYVSEHKIEVVETPDVIYNATEVGVGVASTVAIGVILLGGWLVFAPLDWVARKTFIFPLFLISFMSQLLLLFVAIRFVIAFNLHDTQVMGKDAIVIALSALMFGIGCAVLKPKSLGRLFATCFVLDALIAIVILHGHK